METVISAPSVPTLEVLGTAARFPVRRVYCVGRNYADHAREMGADPKREVPFFFGKPQDALVPGGGDIPYPPATANLHHEVELVVALAQGGSNLSLEQAEAAIFGYAVGIDLTRRDLQAAAKEKGQPWDMAKGFDHSAPVSAITPVNHPGQFSSGAIWLSVGGSERQRGDLADMIWRVPEVISHLSGLVTLYPGDLIFTGTPAGVGALQRGDQVLCGIAGLGELRIRIV
ncbi:MAG TPA: fumarylacetoacetate hydrolase family protein [Geothrix sp.]|nr:fumarylacetoacetate hydrolase family protein [Geothrix sp.]